MRKSIPASSVAVLATAIVLGLLSGLVLPVGGIVLLVALWALPAGMVIVFFPKFFYWAMLVLVLLVSGTVQYFTDHGQLQWVASGIGVCLLVSGFIQGVSAKGGGTGRITGIDAAMIVFVLTATVSTVFGEGGVAHVAAGLRNYLPFLGLYAYLRLGGMSAVTLRRTVWFLLIVALVQWPIELYQAAVVMPQVAAIYAGSAFDSIVGSFGGPKFGGGGSGTLAIYQVFAMALALALHRNRLLSRWQLTGSLLGIVVSIGLAETKVVFVLVPVALALLYSNEVYQRPIRFVLGALFTLGVMAMLLYVYFVFFWEVDNRGNPWVVIVRRFSYSFDPNFRAGINWPGRMTGLAIWWRSQDFSGDAFHWLVGYGVAAATSMSTIAGPGVAALKFGLGTDVTGATKLLWEVGVVGLVAYVAPLVLAFRSFGELLREGERDPLLRAFVQALRASTGVLMLAVLYEVTIVSSPPLQLLAMILYAVAARLASRRPATVRGAVRLAQA